jgi:hypothetical protein
VDQQRARFDLTVPRLTINGDRNVVQYGH